MHSFLKIYHQFNNISRKRLLWIWKWFHQPLSMSFSQIWVQSVFRDGGVFWVTVSWNYVTLMRWHLGCPSQCGVIGGCEWLGHKEGSQREAVDMTDEGRCSDWQGKIKGGMLFQTYLMMRHSKQTTWSSKNIWKSLTLIGGKIIYGVR